METDSRLNSRNQTTPSTSIESEEHQPPQYSKNLLNETGETTHQKTVEPEKGMKKAGEIVYIRGFR